MDSLGTKMARTSVTDIHNRGVWIERNAIRLTNGIVHHEHCTRRRIVSVTGTWELRRCVGKEVKPRILWFSRSVFVIARHKANKRRLTRIRKPDVSRLWMDRKIVDSVKIVSKVVIDQIRRFVRLRVNLSQRHPLLTTLDGPVTTRCSPDDMTVVECASIGSIDRRVRDILGQRRGFLVQIDDQLGEISRHQLGQVQLVLRGHINRCFVHYFRDLKHIFIAGVGAQDVQASFFVVDYKIGRFDCTQLRAIGYSNITKSRGNISSG